MMLSHPKVTPQHLARKAVVYLRQSSPKQVQDNLQSQRLQYALRENAITLGFHEVEMIDGEIDPCLKHRLPSPLRIRNVNCWIG